MLQNRLFKPFLYTLIIVGVIEVAGNTLHLLYSISWFDMVMHFIGGFFVSLSAIVILTQNDPHPSYSQLLLYGVATALTLGLMWEIFELYFDATSIYSPDYVGDNGMDLIMDISGGFVSVVYSYFNLSKYH